MISSIPFFSSENLPLIMGEYSIGLIAAAAISKKIGRNSPLFERIYFPGLICGLPTTIDMFFWTYRNSGKIDFIDAYCGLLLCCSLGMILYATLALIIKIASIIIREVGNFLFDSRRAQEQLAQEPRWQ